MTQSNPFRPQPVSHDEYLAGMWDMQQEVLGLQRLLNGRVSKLEEWRRDVDSSTAIKAARQDGYERGRLDTLTTGPLITKRQVRYLAAAVGAIGVLVPVAWQIIGRLM